MNWSDYVLNGRPFDDVYIFDVHGHIGADIRLQLGRNGADELVQTLDRLGVDSICVSSIPSFASDWVLGNELTRQAVLQHPGRIYGYAVPNPFYKECDVRQFFSPNSGILGIKVHGSYHAGTPLNDHRYDSAFDLANELGLPVLFHAWSASEVRCGVDAASRFPNANFIFGHSGFTDYNAKQVVINGCKKYDNIFIDTAISSTYDGAIEYLVDQVGAENVLYGSDVSSFDCCHTLGRLALSKISDTAKEKILGMNARPLFGL